MRRRWDEPSRTDYYLMQVAREVVRNRVKAEAIPSVTLEQMKIEFETRTSAEIRREQEERDRIAREQAKQAWVAFAEKKGKTKIEHRRVPRE